MINAVRDGFKELDRYPNKATARILFKIASDEDDNEYNLCENANHSFETLVATHHNECTNEMAKHFESRHTPETDRNDQENHKRGFQRAGG